MIHKAATMIEFQVKLNENEENRLVCYGCGGSLSTAVKAMNLYTHLEYFVDNNKKTIKVNWSDFTEKEFSCSSPENMIEVIASDREKQKWIILITSVYWLQIREELDKIELLKNVEVYCWPLIIIRDEIVNKQLYVKRLINPSIHFFRKMLEFQGYEGDSLEKHVSEKELYLKEKQNGEYKNLVLPKLVFFLTSRCTLKCKECTALIPEFQTTVDMDINRVLEDMGKVFDAIDEVIVVQLAGGESLLYPHLEKILKFLIAHEKVLGISFVTNATIIPKESILALLEHPKVFISISDYGMLEKLSKIVALFEKRGIAFELFTSQHWIKVGGTEFRDKSKEQLQFEYLRCTNGEGCKMVENGMLHICDRSARMFMLGKFKSNHDYGPISFNSIECREIIKQIYLADYADACNYCDYANVDAQIIEPAEQIGSKIETSLYTIIKRKLGKSNEIL